MIDGTSITYYPDWQRRLDTAKSSIASTAFIVVNVLIQILIFTIKSIAYSQFRGRAQQLMLFLLSLATTVQISFADYGYQQLAIYLTEMENHRLDSEYYDSLILKLSLSQLFNNYSSLFYVAFVKPLLGIKCEVH